jgi:hypothetical protein
MQLVQLMMDSLPNGQLHGGQTLRSYLVKTQIDGVLGAKCSLHSGMEEGRLQLWNTLAQLLTLAH